MPQRPPHLIPQPPGANPNPPCPLAIIAPRRHRPATAAPPQQRDSTCHRGSIAPLARHHLSAGAGGQDQELDSVPPDPPPPRDHAPNFHFRLPQSRWRRRVGLRRRRQRRQPSSGAPPPVANAWPQRVQGGMTSSSSRGQRHISVWFGLFGQTRTRNVRFCLF